MSIDKCICCGETIPEGRQVCPACEADPLHAVKIPVKVFSTRPEPTRRDYQKLHNMERTESALAIAGFFFCGIGFIAVLLMGTPWAALPLAIGAGLYVVALNLYKKIRKVRKLYENDAHPN